MTGGGVSGLDEPVPLERLHARPETTGSDTRTESATGVYGVRPVAPGLFEHSTAAEHAKPRAPALGGSLTAARVHGASS